jgi:transposase
MTPGVGNGMACVPVGMEGAMLIILPARPMFGQKNEFNDAEAIIEAIQRPTIKFVAVKTAEQLDLQALRRVRDTFLCGREGNRPRHITR